MASVAVIEAVGLRRTYRTSAGVLRRRRLAVEAVRGVSFEVAKGELYGLLGPNGAGKTTTIKMLITLLVPSGGSARVLGYDVVTDTRRVRAVIGYVFGGDRGLYERLSALENLRYYAELYGVEPRAQRRRIAQMLDLVGLAGRERERVEGYSRGMRQRLHIARGLLHDPPVVFLDEPTIGVDPVGARELRATIASLSQQGKTVLLTTHYMFEADALCDRIGVIAGGRLLAQGTPSDLKARVADRTVVEIEAYGVTAGTAEELRRVPGVAAQAKTLSRSGVFLFMSVVEPVIYACISCFMFRAGARPSALLYAAIGAGMLGIWSTTLTWSGQAITLLRQQGALELLVVAPAPFLWVLAPITLATATVGLYSLVATLAWGRLVFGIPLHVEHPFLLVAAVPATVLGLGTLGVVLASVFVLYRHANALTNLLEFPVYLAAGLLVPVALLPGWVRPLSWLLAPAWGAEAIRDATLGGPPLPAIGACLALSAAYLCLGGVMLRRFEVLARRNATLTLT